VPAAGVGAWAPGYSPIHRAVRVSAQFFDTPSDQLPPDLPQQLTSWLSALAVVRDTSMQADSALMTVQLLLPAAAAQQALEGGLEQLLERVSATGNHECWRKGTVLLQVGRPVACLATRCASYWAIAEPCFYRLGSVLAYHVCGARLSRSIVQHQWVAVQQHSGLHSATPAAALS
jgi:hypothetical protein